MFVKVRKFVGEVKVEMTKVTWSSRSELMHSTVIVLVAMAFLATFVGIVDFIFSQLMAIILR